MKNFPQIILTAVMLFSFSTLNAQVAPDIEWQKCLGGTGNEAAFSIQQTTDGGYIVGGYSDLNGGDVTGNHGSDDYWVVKLDSASNLLWQKSLGGNSIEQANAIKQTQDGGFIVAGFSYSNNGDVSGNHGSDDFWIVKLDPDGNLEWQKCLGGSGDDGATSIQQTADGGFIVAGWSASDDGDVSGNQGLLDYWLVKLDMDGGLTWEQSFGGSGYDVAYSAQQTTDGGYIIAGYSESSDGDVSGNNGARDYWIVKSDADGNLDWETFFGGSGYDEAHAVQQLTDGGYIVAGFALSTDGDVSGNNGVYDYWMVRLDSAGTSVWKFCFGGTLIEQPFSVQQTKDGGFIVVGQSNSNNGDVSGNHGGYDFWMVKIDKEATLEWQKSLGGSSDDYGPYGVQETADGGFIVGGASLSNDNDVSGNHGGSFYGDFWIVKLEGDVATAITSPSDNIISLYPNPVQNQLILNLAIPANEVSIRVYDLHGKIRQTSFCGQTDKIVLNTENLAAGFYTLQIISNKTGESMMEKFVKQ